MAAATMRGKRREDAHARDRFAPFSGPSNYATALLISRTNVFNLLHQLF
jgi:hypothetical protein